ATALLLLTTTYRQRVVSDHQSNGACRGLHAGRHDAREARQTRHLAGAELYTTPGRCPFCRNALTGDRWTLSGSRINRTAAPTEDARSANGTTKSAVASQSSADDFRGCALAGPDQP